MHRKHLTGRTRMRAGWFGRLVLQVEEETGVFTWRPSAPGLEKSGWTEEQEHHRTSIAWRDATWFDVQALRVAS